MTWFFLLPEWRFFANYELNGVQNCLRKDAGQDGASLLL
jgi:hypothetical protein